MKNIHPLSFFSIMSLSDPSLRGREVGEISEKHEMAPQTETRVGFLLLVEVMSRCNG